MGSKLEIFPYLFNHNYGLKYSPLPPVSEGGRVEIITIDQSDTITQKSEVGQRRAFETSTKATVKRQI